MKLLNHLKKITAFCLLMLAGLPLLAEAEQGAEPACLPHHRALINNMERADNSDDYISVLRKLPYMREYRHFQTCEEIKPEDVPFEKLSSGEAQYSTWWITESRVAVCPSPESVKYYTDFLFPKLVSFFRKFATQEKTSVAELDVLRDSYSGALQVGISETANALCRATGKGFKIILMRTTKQADFSQLKEGDKLECEVTVLAVPRAYQGCIQGQQTQYTDVEVRLSICNRQGKEIEYGTQQAKVGYTMYTNDGALVVQGFGAGHCSRGNVYLSSAANFKRDGIRRARPAGGAVYSFITKDVIQQLEEEEARKEEERRARAESEARAAEELRKSREPGFFSYCQLFILLSAWATLPVMCVLLYIEHSRRHVALPLPAGWNASMFRADNLHPICNEYIQLSKQLEVRSIDGQQVPVYTERSEVRRGYAWLKKAIALPDKTPDTIYYINQVGAELNSAQKRRMCGSKFILVLAILVFCFMGGMIWMSGEHEVGGAWAALSLAYGLSMMCPAYKLGNKEPLYVSSFKLVVNVSSFAPLKAAADSIAAKDVTVYKDREGNAYVDRDEVSASRYVGAIVACCLVVMAPFYFMLNMLGHFMRNYVASK